jgi:tRNA (guanosine-2'-O-)-methyltransferase
MDHKEAYNYLSRYMTDERDQLFKRVIEERTRKITVVIEDVYQPHNASAVLRSCDCFGVQDVHIIENQNTWEVSEGVSLGAYKWLDVHRYNEQENNTLACLKHLKKQGYRIVATTPHQDDFVPETLPLDEKIALVFGAEVRGISDLVREEADAYLRLPMYGFTESFNISVAAALSLYALTERMRKDTKDWKLDETEKDHVLLQWAKRSIRDGEVILQRYLEAHEKP